jgi:hypothetical protein
MRLHIPRRCWSNADGPVPSQARCRRARGIRPFTGHGVAGRCRTERLSRSRRLPASPGGSSFRKSRPLSYTHSKRWPMPSNIRSRGPGVAVTCSGLMVLLAGCAIGRLWTTPEGERDFAHAAEYRVSCSPRNECRIRYVAEDGSLRNETALGEWTWTLGADGGARLWLQVAGGGCPASTIKASIWIDGEPRAEGADSPSPDVRCQWLTAVAAYEVPG